MSKLSVVMTKKRSPDQRWLVKDIHEMIAKKSNEDFRDSDCFTNVWEWHPLDPNETVRSYVMGDCVVYVTFPSKSELVTIKVAHPVNKDIEFSEFNFDVLLKNDEQGKAVLLNSHQISTTTTIQKASSLTKHITIPLRYHHIGDLLRFFPLEVCHIISLYQANPMCRCEQWESEVSHDCEFFPMICPILDMFEESPSRPERRSESSSERRSESCSDVLDYNGKLERVELERVDRALREAGHIKIMAETEIKKLQKKLIKMKNEAENSEIEIMKKIEEAQCNERKMMKLKKKKKIMKKKMMKKKIMKIGEAEYNKKNDED